MPSLVGSEMCIRDSPIPEGEFRVNALWRNPASGWLTVSGEPVEFPASWDVSDEDPIIEEGDRFATCMVDLVAESFDSASPGEPLPALYSSPSSLPTTTPATTLSTTLLACPFEDDASGEWLFVDETVCVLTSDPVNWFQAGFPCGRADADTCEITFATPLEAEELVEACVAADIPIPEGEFRVNALWRNPASGWLTVSGEPIEFPASWDVSDEDPIIEEGNRLSLIHI